MGVSSQAPQRRRLKTAFGNPEELGTEGLTHLGEFTECLYDLYDASMTGTLPVRDDQQRSLHSCPWSCTISAAGAGPTTQSW